VIGATMDEMRTEKPSTRGRYFRPARSVADKRLLRDRAMMELRESGWSTYDLSHAFGLNEVNVRRSLASVLAAFSGARAC
jgi:hypothetical protein